MSNSKNYQKAPDLSSGEVNISNTATFQEQPPKKRSNLACTTCRNRHIKCDGAGKQCSRCKQFNLVCEYTEAEKKVVISIKYLDRLQQQISKLKTENANLRSLKKSASLSNTNIESQSNFNNDTKSQTFDNSDAKNKHETADESTKLNNDKKSQEFISPFLEKNGRLIHSRTGERLYIGSSSMTLFGLEINKLVKPILASMNNESNKGQTDSHNNIYGNSLNNETILEKEGNAYRIMLGKTTSRPGIDVNFTLPSYSYAMLLVDSFISYNDGCFYFFNEGLVKENLRRIYNDDTNNGFKLDYGIDSINNATEKDPTLETIWFCKLLLIFAIGEMYLGTANYLNGYKINDKNKRKKQKLNNKQSNPQGSASNESSPNEPVSAEPNNNKKHKKHKNTKLPGSGFFNQASDLFTGLFSSGSIDNCIREGGIEVLLLYAFYLQVADCTSASYFYFGIALRASLLLGLHVDIGKDTINKYELEHRRRLWWTVYMYERMLASKAGLPLSLTDEDILTELPGDFDMSNPPPGCENYIYPEAEFISNCVKITQINANILRNLYTRQPSSNILPVVHELVVSLLTWKKGLPDEINCDYSAPKLDISRLVVNMMTEYFQGVNLAVRPLLFHFVSTNLKSSNPKEGKFLDLSTYSPVILALLNASFQASINTIRSLWALVPENMVAMFGYMDREYLFNATATLVLFDATFGVYEATKEHLDHALTLFTKMRNLGNHPATLRREQILKLMSILNFNSAMSDLIEKHTDNLYAPLSFANIDDSYGHKMSVNNSSSSTSQPNTNMNYNSRNMMHHPSLDENISHNSTNTSFGNSPNDGKPTFDSLKHLSNSTEFTVKQFRDFQEQQQREKNQYNNLNTNHNNNNNIPGNNPTTVIHNDFSSFIANNTNNHGFESNQQSNVKEVDSTPNLVPFSPSLSLMFNHVDDIPDFDQLSSTTKDLELWNDITHQAAWLQNDIGSGMDFGEFK